MRTLLCVTVIIVVPLFAACAQSIPGLTRASKKVGLREVLSFDPYSDMYHPIDILVAFSKNAKRFGVLSVGNPHFTVYELDKDIKGIVAQGIGESSKANQSFIKTGKGVELTCLSFHPDAQSLAVGSATNSIFIWDLTKTYDKQDPFSTGLPVALILKGHTRLIKAVQYSRDGNLLASASEDSTIRFWHPANGKLLRTISVGDKVTSLCFTSDSRQLIIGTDSAGVQVFNTTTGVRQLTLMGHRSKVTSVATNGTGLVLSGGADSTVRVWNVHTGQLQQTYQWHSATVTDVGFLGESGYFVSIGRDKSMYVWEVGNDDEPVQTLNFGSGSLTMSIAAEANYVIVLERPANQYHLYRLNR